MELSIAHIADAVALVVGTVAIHSFGSFFLFWCFFRKKGVIAIQSLRYWQITMGLTSVVLALLFLHLLEIGLWAAFFTFQRCLPDFSTSVYFSLITYATVGYGDVVLGEKWRLLAGVEGLAGIMMMSWST